MLFISALFTYHFVHHAKAQHQQHRKAPNALIQSEVDHFGEATDTAFVEREEKVEKVASAKHGRKQHSAGKRKHRKTGKKRYDSDTGKMTAEEKKYEQDGTDHDVKTTVTLNKDALEAEVKLEDEEEEESRKEVERERRKVAPLWILFIVLDVLFCIGVIGTCVYLHEKDKKKAAAALAAEEGEALLVGEGGEAAAQPAA